jgi:hypothetical protein
VVDSSRIYGNAQSLILYFSLLAKVFSDMKKQRNVNLLLMLVLLVAVGQMAQTIYIPAIADMATDLHVRHRDAQRGGQLAQNGDTGVSGTLFDLHQHAFTHSGPPRKFIQRQLLLFPPVANSRGNSQAYLVDTGT